MNNVIPIHQKKFNTEGPLTFFFDPKEDFVCQITERPELWELAERRQDLIFFYAELMPPVERRWYIWHYDTQTPENGEAYFGPFDEDEIHERLNDAYGDALASYGEMEGYQLTDEEAAQFHVNSREYWMEQLEQME